MPPTSQRMEPAMTAEDEAQRLIDRYYKARGPHYSAGSCSQILRSDLLDLLRELIALRAKPAAMDGDAEDDLDALHLLWTDAVMAMLEAIVPGATVDCSPRETDEETISGIVGNVREIIVAQVESLRAANAKMAEEQRWIRTREQRPTPATLVLAYGFGFWAVSSWDVDKQLWEVDEGWSSIVTHWMPLPIAPPSPAPDAEGGR